MVCRICGQTIEKGAKVCTNCGNPVSAPKRSSSKKGRLRRQAVNTAIIVILLLLICSVVYGIIRVVEKLNPSSVISAPPTQSDTLDPSVSTDDKNLPSDSGAATATVNQTTDGTSGTSGTQQTGTTAGDGQQSGTGTPVEYKPTDTIVNPQPEENKEEETPKEYTGDMEQGTTPDPVVEPQVTDDYSLDLTRTLANPQLNHYRLVRYSIREKLPEGVTIIAEEYDVADTAIAKVVKDKDPQCIQIWGKKVGQTTVTIKVTLSNGLMIKQDVPVDVVKDKSKNSSSGSGSTGDGSNGKKNTISNSDYILPNSESHVYTKDELAVLTNNELMLARNEIYARHGYIFRTESIQKYFEGKSWYKGTVQAGEFDSSVLSKTEKKNIAVIQSVEKSRKS